MKHLILSCLLFNSFIITAGASSEIQIWCNTQFDPVSPFLFGSGDEMDEDFLPLEGVTELIVETSVPILRMGGIANEYYDWEGNNYNGVRYLDVLDTLIFSQNCETSMDDFLQMCEENQIVPILSVNFEFASECIFCRKGLIADNLPSQPDEHSKFKEY